MAKVKRASAMVPTPKDADEAGVFLMRLGEAQRQCTLIETALSEQVANLTDKADQEARPHQASIVSLTAGLQLWAEANRATLTRNGATKTIRLAHGELAWRLRPPSVRITGVEAVIETLRKLGLERFLRAKTELDKEAMLREPAEAGKIAGVKVASAGEEFVAAPASMELAGVAVAA